MIRPGLRFLLLDTTAAALICDSEKRIPRQILSKQAEKGNQNSHYSAERSAPTTSTCHFSSIKEVELQFTPLTTIILRNGLFQLQLQAFSLTLANSATLTGRSCIPPGAINKCRPLLVLLHGGRCHSEYYDVDEDHTAATAALGLQLPVVSINRPCYNGTSSFFPLSDSTSFHRETGRWEHSYIFPAIWKALGQLNNCSTIVSMAHSMATPGLLVAAALHAESELSVYSLAGLIISGWGCRRNLNSQEVWIRLSEEQHRKNRHVVMLSAPDYRTADGKMRLPMSEQSVEPPPEKAEECVAGPWEDYFPKIAASINVPITYAVGEHDWLWQGTVDNVNEFAAFFKNCPRFDGSVVRGAPHAIDWSHYVEGWYARCFGFAIEVATHRAIMEES